MQYTTNIDFPQAGNSSLVRFSSTPISAQNDYAKNRRAYYLLAELLCHQHQNRERMIDEGKEEYSSLLPYFPNATPIQMYNHLNHQLAGNSDGQTSLF